MTRQWTELQLKPQVPVLRGYSWDENGFVLKYRDIVDNQLFEISFPAEIDGIKFIFLPNTLEADDRILHLIEEAGIGKTPFLPFFVQDRSSFIHEVRELAGYDAEDKIYKNYIMITDDFWINVVSSTQPQVIYLPEESDTQ